MVKAALWIFVGFFAGTSFAIADVEPKSIVYDRTIAHAPTDPEQVKILKKEPSEHFLRIGEVELVDEAYDGSQSEIFERKLKAEVARLGGDALVIFRDTFVGIRKGIRGVAKSFQGVGGATNHRSELSKNKIYGRKVSALIIKFK